MSVGLRNMTSAYFVRENGILCLFRMGSRVANNKYVGAAGGHFEPSELSDPEACILREIREELGLTKSEIEDLTLRYVTYRLTNGEIRQNYYFFGNLLTDRPLASTEGKLSWISWSELPDLDMPVSAKHMLRHYVQIGRYNHLIYAGITRQTGTEFVPMMEFDG